MPLDQTASCSLGIVAGQHSALARSRMEAAQRRGRGRRGGGGVGWGSQMQDSQEEAHWQLSVDRCAAEPAACGRPERAREGAGALWARGIACLLSAKML